MKKQFTLLVLLTAISFVVFAGGQKRKVLVIGVDGCRSDALQQAVTPNIDSLVAKGFYSYNSWHCDITVSGPSWSSIMCGVYHNKHGVTGNSYSNSNYNVYPYFPKRAKEIKPNLKCIQYTEWAPMSDNVYNDGWDSKLKGPDGATSTTGDAAVAQIQDPDVDVLFTYFDAVDLSGHATGFTPNNTVYINAIQNVDVQIGRIIHQLRLRPTYAQEDWLVLLTTDHGGIGTGHGGNTITERNIWWIGYSDRGIAKQISGPDPGTYNTASLPTIPAINTDTQKLAPVQVDIAVTALHHLIYGSGVRPEQRTDWNLDGKSWLCDMGLCDATGVEDIADGGMEVKVFPNPSFGMLTLYYTSETSKNVGVKVFDNSGRLVLEKQNFFQGVKENLDLSTQPKGAYYIEIKDGEKTVVKKVVLQ